MSLIIKPPSWSNCTSNLASATLGTNPGNSLIANANNVDGTAVSCLAAVAHDVEYLVIGISGFNISTGNGSTLMDVLVDPAGGSSWASFINDLLVGEGPANAASVPTGYWYHFPVSLKSGNSIGVQARTAHTANITTGKVIVYAYGANANPGSWWCGQSVTTVGVTAASSQGTNHTPGSGVFSAWTNFGSTLPAAAGAFQFAVQGTNTNTTQASDSNLWEFGVGSTAIGPTMVRTASTIENGWFTQSGLIFSSQPSGAQMQVRARSNAASPQAFDVAAYAVH